LKSQIIRLPFVSRKESIERAVVSRETVWKELDDPRYAMTASTNDPSQRQIDKFVEGWSSKDNRKVDKEVNDG